MVHFDYDFPRDAKDQVNYNALIDVDSTDEIQSEDLLFFKKGDTVDHVAIATMGYDINDAYVCDSDYDKSDKRDLIMHASGYKGIVCYQSLDDSGLKDSLYKIKRHVSKTL